jgi:arabinan endo-1,5-alpha-L-arabinosidase
MKWIPAYVLAVVACAAPLCAEEPTPPAAAPAAGQSDAERVVELGSRGVRVHDPSTIVKSKDEYWVFHTGRGVPSHRSRDLVRWEPGPRVFESPPAWVAAAVPGSRGGMDFWAPDGA